MYYSEDERLEIGGREYKEFSKRGSYHSEIMNIHSAVEDYDYMGCQVYSYNEGHLDARHAAAEIALKADSEIAELVECVRMLRDTLEYLDLEDCGGCAKRDEAMVDSYDLLRRLDL